FQLQLAVKVQVLQKSRVATYTFHLEPLSVERIDVLESKLRDLQDEVAILRSKGTEASSLQNSTIQKLEEGMKKVLKDAAGRDIVILQLKEEVKAIHLAQESSTTKTQGDLICWRNSGFVFGLNPIVTSLDGIVRVESTGTYQVAVVVNHQAAGHNMSLQMMKGSDCIQSAYCGYAQGHLGSTTLTCTAHLDKNEQLAVKCPASLVETSYLTLIRLGK
ncbi:hypothetical protein JG687_00008850, partial [Phytophthora cactorum]